MPMTSLPKVLKRDTMISFFNFVPMASNMSSKCPEGFENVKTIPGIEGFHPLACLQQKDGLERRLVVDNPCNDGGAIICGCQATAEQVQKCVLSARDIVRSPDSAENTLAKARLGCAEAREDELAKLMSRPGRRVS